MSQGEGPRRRPTIRDVAARAGVSRTTVSLVMNDRPGTGIPPVTRDRVLAAVRELGYVPDRQARNLGLKRTGVLGYHLLARELSEDDLFSLSLFRPLVQSADRHDHQVVAFTAQDDEDVVDRMRRMVAARAVDAFVLHDLLPDDRRVAYLADIGFPFAAWGTTGPDRPQSWVEVDCRGAYHDLVDHLVAQGHSRVGFVLPDRPGAWWSLREDAFRERMGHHGLAVAPEDVLHLGADRADDVLGAWLRREQRPTAVVTGGDLLALRVYRAAGRVGLAIGPRVADQLAVAGFDPLLSTVDPPLTTVTVSFDDLAERIVQRCLREVAGPTGAPGEYLPARLLVRRSA